MYSYSTVWYYMLTNLLGLPYANNRGGGRVSVFALVGGSTGGSVSGYLGGLGIDVRKGERWVYWYYHCCDLLYSIYCRGSDVVEVGYQYAMIVLLAGLGWAGLGCFFYEMRVLFERL